MRQRGAGGSSGGVPPDLLGKDEVASSNLASSSIKIRNHLVSDFFIFVGARFELMKHLPGTETG